MEGINFGWLMNAMAGPDATDPEPAVVSWLPRSLEEVAPALHLCVCPVLDLHPGHAGA
jgi:hypothetical protein